MNDIIQTTSAIKADWIALEHFHWRASIDRRRPAPKRRWHRRQWSNLRQRRLAEGQDSRAIIKVAVIAKLSEIYKAKLLKSSKPLFAGNWRKFCDAAKRALEQSP